MTDDPAHVGEEADRGPRDDLLDRFDKSAADQVIRQQLDGRARRSERRLVGLGDDLEMSLVAVRPDRPR